MIDPGRPLRLKPRWNHTPSLRLKPHWTTLEVEERLQVV